MRVFGLLIAALLFSVSSVSAQPIPPDITVEVEPCTSPNDRRECAVTHFQLEDGTLCSLAAWYLRNDTSTRIDPECLAFLEQTIGVNELRHHPPLGIPPELWSKIWSMIESRDPCSGGELDCVFPNAVEMARCRAVTSWSFGGFDGQETLDPDCLKRLMVEKALDQIRTENHEPE